MKGLCIEMKGLCIRRDDAVVAGRVRIEIPRRYFRNDDHARDFMDVLSRMRTFKLAMLNYEHPELHRADVVAVLKDMQTRGAVQLRPAVNDLTIYLNDEKGRT